MDRWTRIAPGHVPGRTRFNEVPKFDQGLYDLGNDIYAWMVPNGSWGESNAGLLSGEFSKQPFSGWNSPERMMSNLYTLYRHFKGRTNSPTVPALLNIMRRQAMLAHRLPEAEPAIMRKL